jgi:hypothetical protein
MLPSLWAQLEDADAITKQRPAIWRTYHEAFADLEQKEPVLAPTSSSVPGPRRPRESPPKPLHSGRPLDRVVENGVSEDAL